ncbi:preprotein translocase subunit SecE [Candidatus Saccharibacteria bacterium]|nr:preprotein translocase subunit SecE [Candidatus Saccharibacteria bacterium]
MTAKQSFLVGKGASLVSDQKKKPISNKRRMRLPQLPRRVRKSDDAVGYFGGAWRELRQVRWPNRPATWGLTLAVILFSLFFAVMILALDYGFNELFRKVLL